MTRRMIRALAALALAALAALSAVLCSCGDGDSPRPKIEPPDEPIAVANRSAGTLLDFFADVAFGSEYGEGADIVCKWEKRVKYYIKGDATDEDRELIARLCERLNEIDGFPGVSEASGEASADMTVSFIPRDEIRSTFANATADCAGMAMYEWDPETGEILSARCAIDSALGADRKNTVCEEFLQSLGPARDSYMFSESAFYQGYTLMPFPSETDFAVLRILYSPRITVGMSRLEALSVAATLLDWGE